MLSPSQSPTAIESGSLEVHLLGLVEYDAAVALQERLVYELSGRHDTQGVLLLCEHPPLITIGREGSQSHVLASPQDLEASEIGVRWVARGGGAMVHAVGQLSVSLLMPLGRMGLQHTNGSAGASPSHDVQKSSETVGISVSDYRARLAEALLATCRDVRVPAKRVPDAPGLWSRGGQLASLGATLKNGITQHGANLHVNPDPGFLKLVESSPPGERLTSLQIQRGRRIEMSSVRESLVHHLSSAFDYERVHVYTGHPLLKRTTKRVCLNV